jgi:ankyrin repeat protein
MFSSKNERRLGACRSRPSGLLMQDIQQKNWDAARGRLRTYAIEAQFRSESSRKTPLHVALMNRAPRDVVDMLLEAHPNALFAQDAEGWTPLHVSILYNVRSDDDTTRNIIRLGGRIGGCLHSRYVGSPLHLACRHSCSHEVLIELLKVSPNQVRVRNEAGMTPANLLWKAFVRHKSLKEPSEAQVLLEQLCLLLAASNGSPILDHRVLPSFDQALAFQQRYADETDFVRVLLWFHPRTLQDPLEIPLHRAAAYYTTCRSIISASIPGSSATQDPMKHVLDRLTDKNLAAASASCDTLGRLPIHYAIATGKRTWRLGLLDQLIRLHPDGLLRRDPLTGLYPFQLAALANEETPPIKSSTSHHECTLNSAIVALETVYQLLRKSPQVIGLAARNSVSAHRC